MNQPTHFFLKYFIFLFSVSSTQFINGQERISFLAYQDVHLVLTGDDYYQAGTLDVLMKVKLQGIQNEIGYMFVAPEFEYSNLDGIYKRYAIGTGFTFNDLGKTPVDISLSGSYGWIDRWGKTMFSFNAQGEISYRLTPSLKIVLLSQLTERSDLAWRYADKTIRFSGFIGLEIIPEHFITRCFMIFK